MNKEERSTIYYMVEALYDQSRGPLAHQVFTEWELKFINDMMVRFTNDPDYELSDNQFRALTSIWEKL